MVQTTNRYSIPRPTEYWKLDSGEFVKVQGLRDELHEKNFQILKNVSRARLRVLLVRCQRRLLSYEGMPLRELKLYADQRGLTASPKTTPTALKALLEIADDDATFDRFSDLPPELRRIIFVHYYNSFPSQDLYTYNKAQPPITMASRNTRQESLPLFYNCIAFAIATFQSSALGSYNLTEGFSGGFMQSINAQDFACIRQLDLFFSNYGPSCKIDLHDREDPINVRPGWMSTQVEQDRLKSELRPLALGIIARKGPLELRISDIEEMVEVARRVEPRAE